MKILLAVHHFPPRYSAGAELYTYRLARWLLARGHEAEVVCVEDLDYRRPASLEAKPEHFDGIPVWRLSLGMQGAPASWSYNHELINRWLAGHLAVSQPDLIHLQSGYLLGGGVLEVAQAAGIPSVVTLHDYWFLCPRFTLLRGDGKICSKVPDNPADCAWCQQMANRRYRLTDRVSAGLVTNLYLSVAENGKPIAERRTFLARALGRASVVIAPSHFLAGHFVGRVDADRLHVLPLGVDATLLRATPPAPVDGPLKLAYIGQISAHKGVHVLIEAVRRLPAMPRPVELVIHGNLAANPAYARKLRGLIGGDRRITLAGPFVNQQIGAVLGPAHAVVVPSLWFENSPLSILEAQAAGRPVLASAMGGMAEMVRDEVDGLHFRPGDSGDLARQIGRLGEEPGLLGRLTAQTRVPPSIDEAMAAMLSLYEQVNGRHAAHITEVA